jgi:Holliday junction resolvase RusA-like endonuclease
VSDTPSIIRFFVDERPIPQPRGRPCRVGDGTMRVIVDSDHPVFKFRNAVQATAYLAYRGKPPLAGPLRIDAEILLPRPQNMIWKRKPMPRELHITKPDRDNLEKAIFDALKGILFLDDGQICDGRTRKFIAAGDERPGTWITVVPL